MDNIWIQPGTGKELTMPVQKPAPVSIMGIHEDGGEEVLRLPKNGGVIVFTERIGHDRYEKGGRDYSSWTDQGYVPYVRLNNGYFPDGTIPVPSLYEDFAVRVANYIQASQGCYHWIIGNEFNHEQEWPHGDPIHAEDAITCCNKVALECFERGLIHEGHRLSPGAVAPWNTQSEPQDWIGYFADLLHECVGIDFITIHTYTHGWQPALITSEEKMAPPYESYHYHFRAYRDFMEAIPEILRDKEVIISETNQDAPWLDQAGTTWMQEAFTEVDHWNRGIAQAIGMNVIRALCPYRWPNFDNKHIIGNTHVIADYHKAVALNLVVPGTEGEEPMPTPEWRRIFTLDCEGANNSAFYDQNDIPELTIPKQTAIHWRWAEEEGFYDRPEADHKDKEVGQSEVFEGLRSCATYFTWSKGQAWYLTDRISVPKHTLVRGAVAYMHVFQDKAVGGSQCGIVLGDGPFATDRTIWPESWEDPCNSPSITWGDWRTSRVGSSDYLADRAWATLDTPEVSTEEYSFIRFIVRANADERGQFSGFHYDVFTVEALTEDEEPPVKPPSSNDCEAEETVQQLRVDLANTLQVLGEGLVMTGQSILASLEEWKE